MWQTSKRKKLSLIKQSSYGIRCDTTYTKLNLTGIKGIQIVDWGISEKDKIRHINDLNLMSQDMLDVFRRKKMQINLTSGGVTNFPKFQHLKGTTPVNWPQGRTWDNIPGTGDSRGVYLGSTSLPHGAYSLAIHEAANSVDLSLNKAISDNPKISELNNRYKNNSNPSDNRKSYRLSNRLEFVAASIDEYYCSQRTNSKLKAMYTVVYQFIQTNLKSILQ